MTFCGIARMTVIAARSSPAERRPRAVGTAFAGRPLDRGPGVRIRIAP